MHCIEKFVDMTNESMFDLREITKRHTRIQRNKCYFNFVKKLVMMLIFKKMIIHLSEKF